MGIEPGTLIDGRYRVMSRLGEGGMSVVYRAHDEQLGREVALKLFRPAMVDVNDESRRRGEVSVLAALGHPTLVTLFDARLDVDPAYLTTEFVDGSDLQARLRAGALPGDQLHSLAVSVADALAFMHERGVVHRDVKPANILLPRERSLSAPFAKLGDFGIARLVDGSRMTAVGSVIGTAAYLSPEQAGGHEAGPASDVYSLGLVLIESASGIAPFPGSAVESAVARLTRRPDVPQDLSRDWQALLSGMTEQSPADRLTAAEAFHTLAALPRPTAGAAVPPPTAEDELAKTLLLPAASPASAAPAAPDVVTELMPSASRREPLRSPTPRPSRPDRPTPPTRAPMSAVARRRLTLGVVAAVATIALIVGISALSSLPGASSVAPSGGGTPYPTVTGSLGDHLAELQRSVAP